MKLNENRIIQHFPKRVVDTVETPCYLISEEAIRCNCEILQRVQSATGAKILLALKAYALPATFPLIRRYLHGVCASGAIEARLGREEFGREVHTFSPAFADSDIEEVIQYSDRIIFNSVYQWKKFRSLIAAEGRGIECGIRCNPGHAEVEIPLYNPCAPGSRFGVHPEHLEGEDLTGIDGLHFHALCEQNADVLVRVLESFEKRFGRYIGGMKWINFGGGHHITRPDYDIDLLCRTIADFRKRHDNIPVYLEPGEAVVLNAGVLVATVVDIVNNDIDIAILDTSAETHMPDVLAMPYRPAIAGAGNPGEFAHTYRLAGNTCLAGDVIGDYSFGEPLSRGDRLIFFDMALYSFVKNSTFNGMKLPSLIVLGEDGTARLVRRFGYADYLSRIC